MSEEEQEYILLKEVAEQMGIKRASVYYYINKLEIEPIQFENNNHAYITKEDFERVKTLKEQPWKVSPQKARSKRNKKDKSVA